ncbi:MAG: hypothetical protein EWM45_13055 [Rhodopseudomonas palustris]|nr:MAG: hypothetical protein EWM45_13055 [Rhodopseudomonas palustris]
MARRINDYTSHDRHAVCAVAASPSRRSYLLRYWLRAAHCPPPPAARRISSLLEGDCVGL